MKAITPKHMADIEHKFMNEHSYSSILLMEQAAISVLYYCLPHCNVDDKVAILAGKGNNGGDAYALARLLFSRGIICDVYCTDYPKTNDAIENRRLLESIYQPNIYSISEFEDKGYSLIVDGIFGTGFYGDLPHDISKVFDKVNDSSAYKIAIDIPSGLDGSTGYASNAFVADETICFHKLKQGLLLSLAPKYTGRIHIENIGILDNSNDGLYVVDNSFVADMLKPISPIAYKGKQGNLLVIAGSDSYAGAALMNCKAAIRSGIGLITLASNEHTVGLLQSSELTPIGRILDSDASKEKLLSDIDKYDCVSIGSGMESSTLNDNFVISLIENIKYKNINCVLDAEAINIVARHKIRLASNFTITPHPGEAARLLGIEVTNVIKDYIACASRLYQDYGANIILKGARTLIYDGKNFAINTTGNASLAKGGSGDCLCGIVSALIANKSINTNIFHKSALACYIFGRASDIAVDRYGEYSSNAVTAIDFISASIADTIIM